MHVALREGADLAGFRQAVRKLMARNELPQDVVWETTANPGLVLEDETLEPVDARPVALPRPVGELAKDVVCHRDPERYALLYRLIWRVTHGERALLEVASDPLVHKLEMMRKTVGRAIHKMHAFVRFREVLDPNGDERFVAWFEPEHFILEAAAPFFVDRFGSLNWSILTPLGSLHWDRKHLRLGPPAKRQDAPDGDAFEAGWQTYYESTFNPARVNPELMRQHMARKYWRNMPETAAIPELIRSAASRVDGMMTKRAADALKRSPDKAVAAMSAQEPKSLAALNRIIEAADPFVEGSARAVLGEGPIGADVAFVGEQPGDREDLQGHPFVGPAGQLLDRALDEAGIERKKIYVTNAVKHFKFVQRGKRRLHQSPTAAEVKHYRWWLAKELDFVRPKLTVALGSSAVLALAGKQIPITRNRGPYEFEGHPGYITVHPSYLLRIPNASEREAAYAAFVADMKRIRKLSEA